MLRITLPRNDGRFAREPDATMQPTPQDNQLMSKHRVLSFKPQLRLEWRGQDGQNETEQPDHSASLGDSITASTQIRFSVHTLSKAGQNRQGSQQGIAIDMEEIGQDQWSMLHYAGLSRACALLRTFLPNSCKNVFGAQAKAFGERMALS